MKRFATWIDMNLMKQKLICALIVALALALGPLGCSVYQYVTWRDIPVENHAAAIRALKFFLFIFMPGMSFSSLILCLMLFGALRRNERHGAEH